MNPEEVNFEEFFAERMRQKGVSAKKLADMTGITPRHLAEIAAGDFAALPSAPYVRGYLIRLGEVLDFDGEAWWQKVKLERRVKNSGATDALPKNRFMRKYPTRYVAGGIVALIAIVYAVVQFPKIIGKPSLSLAYPSQNPFTTVTGQLTMQGTVQGADSLSIDGENVSFAGGTWQKDILLSNGVNQITVTAKKFLGGSTEITEQVVYEPSGVIFQPANGTSTANPSSASSATGQ